MVLSFVPVQLALHRLLELIDLGKDGSALGCEPCSRPAQDALEPAASFGFWDPATEPTAIAALVPAVPPLVDPQLEGSRCLQRFVGWIDAATRESSLGSGQGGLPVAFETGEGVVVRSLLGLASL
ncbi:MAG: hypothetical protein IH827_10140 [Myxococcales bacterium]|nr:hypothetical protein [Myxococcales bacterium]